MRIGFYQFSPMFKEKTENLKKIEETLLKVNADLIVLPELCNTGYSFLSRNELKKYAEKIPDGETTQTLINMARKKNTCIVAGLAERDKNHIYNSAILVKPDGQVKTYRKAHLFYREKFIFDKGNIKFLVHPFNNVKIGVLICFDYIFPEASRSLALAGAQIICHPSNLILPYAQKATITRAVENRVFFIMANRVGQEKLGSKHLKFNGHSQIISPDGEILAKAGPNEEKVKIVKIDPTLALDKMITPYNNVITDRRTDLYYK
jgi:predicted amidohydrolase